MKKWNLLSPPPSGYANEIPLTCLGCGIESLVAVSGIPLAQVGQGIVFDGSGKVPERIRCPHCLMTLESFK